MTIFGLEVGFSTAMKRFLTDLVSNLERKIMATLQELTAKVDELVAKNEQLTVEVEQSTAKTDELIVVAQTCKDALVAALAQIGQGGTPEQLAVLTAKVQGAIDNASAAIDALDAQDAQTDAAKGEVAP